METGNRLLILVIAVIVLATLWCAYSLELHGKASGAFIPIAVGAIGTLTPSALKQAQRLMGGDQAAAPAPPDEGKP